MDRMESSGGDEMEQSLSLVKMADSSISQELVQNE